MRMANAITMCHIRSGVLTMRTPCNIVRSCWSFLLNSAVSVSSVIGIAWAKSK